MRRLTVLMTEIERDVLAEMARRAYREPRDQLRVILRQEAQRQGLLPSEDMQAHNLSTDAGSKTRGVQYAEAR